MIASDKSPSRKEPESEVLVQLRAAREWLQVLIDAGNIDPEETVFAVSVRSAKGEEERATATLAHCLAQIDAAIVGAAHG